MLTIRPGVVFAPDAAASFRRAEASWGEPIDVNSSYRDWDRQMSMYLAWQAWVNGTGPKPPHARAIHPKYSKHCLGLALDSDDWTRPGFIAHMEEHGWFRTAAADPTERHHFEYQSWRDKRRNDPAPPAPATLEDIVTAHVLLYLYTPNNNLLLVDHLNMTIRELGNKPTFERDQFDHLPHTKIAEPLWTQMFRNYAYVTQPNLAPGVE